MNKENAKLKGEEHISANEIRGNLSASIPNIISALFFLFFIQQLTFLVESIYMLNLLHTKMDLRVLGVLLLAIPVFLVYVRQSKTIYIFLASFMLCCMLLSPLFPPALRIFSSGMGAGLYLLYLGLQLTDKWFSKVNFGQSIALATLASIFFRLFGHTLDISISGNTIFIGWILIGMMAIIFFQKIKRYPGHSEVQKERDDRTHGSAVWLYVPGTIAAFILIYFVISSPGVIARWTQGRYDLIILVISLSIIFIFFFGWRKIINNKISKTILIAWNVTFLFFFIWNILLHRVSFPTLQDLTPVTVADGELWHAIITYAMLILSPVIFVNIGYFSQYTREVAPAKMAGPLLFGAGLIIFCIFALIFTNTWGYVGDVSRIFRNQFHLPFAVAIILMIIPYIFSNKSLRVPTPVPFSGRVNAALFLLVISLLGVFMLYGKEKTNLPGLATPGRLSLMTYNIQQGVDYWGNKNFEGQLTRIKEINPDILCLQESDAARISGGNSDVVRYFEEKLSYFTYYGPKTVTGTYGTAILARFPLDSCRTIFTYSSKDEIGTAVASISIDGMDITVINSHPAGNNQSRQEHINLVESLANNTALCIAMGDYNFTQDSPYYRQITRILKDAWLDLYPNAVGTVEIERLDMSFSDRKSSSGELEANGTLDMTNRIDHIFLSKDFEVLESHYMPAPESETDHPLHWVVVSWP